MPLSLDEAAQVRLVEQALLRKFEDRVPAPVISYEVDAGMREFSGARIRTYVPILLHKLVVDRLREHPRVDRS